jgi:pimeloyl-ACP methyl ester carboxylesterase
VICPDLRGAGRTDAPPDGYTGDQLQADVLALLDQLGLNRVHLMTHDWSSILGFLLCLQHPERFHDHLAMSVPSPNAKLDRGFGLRAMRHGWFNLILPWPGLGPWALRAGPLPRFMMRANSTSLTDELIELFTSQLREPARARAGSALYRKFIQPEGLRAMRGKYRDQELTVPTRVLIGADDHVVKADFKDAVEIRGAGHFLVDDVPDEVVRHALEFFRSRGPE